MLQTIRTAITTKLNTLVWAGKPLAVVYDYYPLGISGYPAVMFEPTGLDSSFMTTDENYRDYGFKIVLLQEFNTIPRSTAMWIIIDAFDQIVYEFDKDFTLGWVIEMLDAVPWDVVTIDYENWVALAIEMKISCRVIRSINTL